MRTRNKLRPDAKWNTFTTEQKKQLEEWLLDQNLSFRETHERAQKELGLTCCLATIGRIHYYLIKTRTVRDVRIGKDAAKEVAETGVDLAELRTSSLKVVGTRMLEKAMENGSPKEVAAYGRLLLQSQERDIEEARVALARERFEFKAAKAALEVVPMLEGMDKEQEQRELERIQAIKYGLFGKQWDKIKRPNPPNNSQ